VFHTVPDEVLEELFESTPVGAYRPLRLDAKRRIRRTCPLPALFDEFVEVDSLDILDILAVARQCQQVIDECRHALVSTSDVVEMWRVALLAGEFQPSHGDVERAPKVVRDDRGELVEALVLSSKRLFVTLSIADIADNADAVQLLSFLARDPIEAHLYRKALAVRGQKLVLDRPGLSFPRIDLTANPTRLRCGLFGHPVVDVCAEQLLAIGAFHLGVAVVNVRDRSVGTHSVDCVVDGF